jgi:hypothetical protein
MIELTEEQRQAVRTGEPVRLLPPEIGRNVVMLLEEQYEKLRAAWEEEQADRKLQAGWQKLAYRGLALDEEP